jgi:hypothetical protein
VHSADHAAGARGRPGRRSERGLRDLLHGCSVGLSPALLDGGDGITDGLWSRRRGAPWNSYRGLRHLRNRRSFGLPPALLDRGDCLSDRLRTDLSNRVHGHSFDLQANRVLHATNAAAARRGWARTSLYNATNGAPDVVRADPALHNYSHSPSDMVSAVPAGSDNGRDGVYPGWGGGAAALHNYSHSPSDMVSAVPAGSDDGGDGVYSGWGSTPAGVHNDSHSPSDVVSAVPTDCYNGGDGMHSDRGHTTADYAQLSCSRRSRDGCMPDPFHGRALGVPSAGPVPTSSHGRS